MNIDEVKHLVILGTPLDDLTEALPHLDPEDGFTYLDNLADLVPEGGYSGEDDQVVNTLLYHFKNRTPIYVCKDPDREDRRILNKVMLLRPDMVLDQALDQLIVQMGDKPCTSPQEFQDMYFDALERFNVDSAPIEFADDPDNENKLMFWPAGRLAQVHSIEWCEDGIVELDGMVMRSTAVMCVGHIKHALMGGQVLKPVEVAAFIASRLVTNGVEDLIGYGRAFGPGKEDQTNATLTPAGRRFRALGVVGVVAATATVVTKARPEMVEDVAKELRRAYPLEFLLPHQQMRELYFGEEAAKAFRAKQEDDGRWTLYGKSSKHTRVDAGAYVLYTEEGDAKLTRKALIGAFECGNDGSIYAPLKLMEDIGGWLKETAGAVRDFKNMSPDLRARYYNAEMKVQVGDLVMPGDLLFTMDETEHKWESKADWGIVREVIDEMNDRIVRVRIEIDAHFEVDFKMRGFGKGLCCPSEAAGITGMVRGEKGVDRIIIGAPGIIKDSAAANEYISNAEKVIGTVVTEYNPRDYELAKLKHMPEEVDGKLVKHYPETGITMYFNDRKLKVTEIDPNAIACDITFMIEAAPVAQSVGTSGMTMPQMAWISSLPTGNTWLKQHALKGTHKRTEALAYLHAVKDRIPLSLGKK